MLFRCDIKEEQQLFMAVATHERIKISPCTMLSSENIVIQINNLCQEISSAQLGLFNKNLVKSPNFVRVSRQQTIPGCFKAGSCRCETFQELLSQSVLCCANHKSCSWNEMLQRFIRRFAKSYPLTLLNFSPQTDNDWYTDLVKWDFLRLMPSAVFLLSSFIFPLSRTS